MERRQRIRDLVEKAEIEIMTRSRGITALCVYNIDNEDLSCIPDDTVGKNSLFRNLKSVIRFVFEDSGTTAMIKAISERKPCGTIEIIPITVKPCEWDYKKPIFIKLFLTAENDSEGDFRLEFHETLEKAQEYVTKQNEKNKNDK
jgi:hypothetical protein